MRNIVDHKKNIWVLIFGLLILMCTNDKIIDHYGYQVFKKQSSIPYTFAIFKDTENNDDTTVLYYFHGKGGNALSWLNIHREIIRQWRKTGKPVPVVVSLSFGDRWLLVPKNSSEWSGYLEYCMQTVFPEIEKHIGTGIENRYVMGQSMGGYNAAQLVFRYPEKYSKAAIISPAIFPFSLYSDKIEQYTKRVKENVPGFRDKLKLFFFNHDSIKKGINTVFNAQKRYIPDQEAWEHSNIILNMKEPGIDNNTVVYISCGDRDVLGFYIGAYALAEKARSLSYQVKWELLKGGHVVMDPEKVVEFFISD